MGLIISAEDLTSISRHCEDHYPLEGCGILIGRVEEDQKNVLHVLLTENDCQEGMRNRRYTIPPAQLLQGELQAEASGLEVIGYFHSHPDHPARPSVHDFELAWPNYSYLIVAVQDRVASDLRSWQLGPDRSGFVEETIIRIPQQTDQSKHTLGADETPEEAITMNRGQR